MKAPSHGDPCWIDGDRTIAREIGLALDDPLWLAGVGLFETLAVEDGELLDLGAHLARLDESARTCELSIPTRHDIARALADAATVWPTGWVKIVVTGGGRWIVFGGARNPVAPAVTAVILPWRRDATDPVLGHKTTSRAREALGLAWARRRGADEGIWRNGRGHVAEACTANVFVIHGRRLFTPGLREGILPGIVRARAIEAARGLGWVVHEGKLRCERFRRASEAFLTSSVAGVRPLVSVDGVAVGTGRPGPGTAQLAQEIARLRRAARLGPASLDSAPRHRDL